MGVRSEVDPGVVLAVIRIAAERPCRDEVVEPVSIQIAGGDQVIRIGLTVEDVEIFGTVIRYIDGIKVDAFADGQAVCSHGIDGALWFGDLQDVVFRIARQNQRQGQGVGRIGIDRTEYLQLDIDQVGRVQLDVLREVTGQPGRLEGSRPPACGLRRPEGVPVLRVAPVEGQSVDGQFRRNVRQQGGKGVRVIRGPQAAAPYEFVVVGGEFRLVDTAPYDQIVALAALDQVVAPAAEQHVVAIVAVYLVVPVPAEEVVDTISSVDLEPADVAALLEGARLNSPFIVAEGELVPGVGAHDVRAGAHVHDRLFNADNLVQRVLPH